MLGRQAGDYYSLTCSGATVRASNTAAVPTILLRAQRFEPRTLWRLERGEHQMEARLMPHAQYIAVVILVDGRARTAKEFAHQTDALRWADEQRVINASAAR